MTIGLDFLSPALAEPSPRSPLARGLAGSNLADLSLSTGVLDVRGAVEGLAPDGAEVVRLSPGRALVLCAYADAPGLAARLGERGLDAVDLSGGFAGLEVRGERVMRRLTELRPDRLPAVGSVAHVPALVLRDGERFRLHFRQEYADHMAEVVRDTLEGLD